MSEMTQDLKKKLMELAETYEEKPEDVLLLFHALKQRIIEIEPHLLDIDVKRRTYNGIKDYYNNKRFKKGSEFFIIPFGVQQEPKDTNKVNRDEIVKDFSNPTKRLIMISGEAGDGTDAKIMSMKTNDKVIDGKTVLYTDVYKPVKTIRKMTRMDSGEWVVVDGDLWEPGDTPIARHHLSHIQYKEDGDIFENRMWSRKLDPNWKFAIFGLGFFTGSKEVKTGEGGVKKKEKNPIEDGMISRITFYGEYSNPMSPKFIGKKDIWFKACKLKVTDTNYSNELFIQTTAKSDIESSSTKLKLVPYKDKKGAKKPGILNIVNKRVEKKALFLSNMLRDTAQDKMPKDKLKKLQDTENLYNKFLTVPYIPIIDLFGINGYHLTHRAIQIVDKEGAIKIKKDDAGVWDDIDFDSFAICECSYTGIYKADGKAPKYILSDWSMPENQSVFTKFAVGLSQELPSSTVYIALTTSRGNQAYDVDTKQWVVDPDNAVAIPKIKGIGVIMDFTKINIEKLIGDM